jgi:murein DD-endopeptidase MepM/ murein hydrolase activator NlpD
VLRALGPPAGATLVGPLIGPATPPGVASAVKLPAAAADRVAARGLAALVRPSLPVTVVPTRLREGVIKHEVEAGDTVWSLAQRYGISSQTILWANQLSEEDLLQIGQQLLILPVSGVYHQVQSGDTIEHIAERYRADPQAIRDVNHITNQTLAASDKLIVPGGILPEALRPRTLARPETPAAAAASSPAAAGPPTGSGRFAWPARGEITTYFSGWHPGIDIAGTSGTPILAADDGVVAFTGWDTTGYGYRIVIDHGNGWVTTYNHLLPAFQVRAGEEVSQGQVVGLMGSTGRSTGPHLHLEFLLNGRFVNPLGVL